MNISSDNLIHQNGCTVKPYHQFPLEVLLFLSTVQPWMLCISYLCLTQEMLSWKLTEVTSYNEFMHPDIIFVNLDVYSRLSINNTLIIIFKKLISGLLKPKKFTLNQKIMLQILSLGSQWKLLRHVVCAEWQVLETIFLSHSSYTDLSVWHSLLKIV